MRLEDVKIDESYHVNTALRTEWPSPLTPILPSYKELRLNNGDIIKVRGIVKDVGLTLGGYGKPQYFVDAVIFAFNKEHHDDPRSNFCFVPVDWLAPVGKVYPQ
jgi:hypothetical protein